MKNTLCLLLFVFSVSYFYGQNFQLTGKVCNREHIPVELASVLLKLNDSIHVNHVTTDSLGSFTLQVEAGKYTLHIRQFGEELYKQNLSLEKDTDLGVIEINESQLLEGVVVEGRKKIIERKADRLVFHVENAASAGGNALDVLKATPMVRVQDETVSIIGKSEVLVMIDDHLQRLSSDDLANLLQSIPADQIKSIEVITTPPAKYEAEGNSGLINIRLKSAKANSWNANIGATYKQRTYAGGNLNGMLNYNHHKLSFQFSVSSGKNQYLTTSEHRIFYPTESWKTNTKDLATVKGFSIGAGLDYKLTRNWTSGVKYSGSFTDESNKNNPFTSRTAVSTGAVNSYVSSDVNAANKPVMHSLNWGNTFKADSSGRMLTIELDYFNYRKKDARFFSGNELDENRSILPATFFSSTNSNTNQIQNYSFKTDVEMPFSFAALTFGGKLSHTETINNLSVYDHESGTAVLNPNQSNLFRYREYNEALYSSISKKLGKKWDSQIGLRVEFTQTEGYSKNLDQTNRNHYIKLFPTAYITYSPNDNRSFSLNYSRRIRRSGFDYLNPFIVRSSPYYYSEGNPFLKPTIIDNLEFSYVHRQNWVSSVYYSHISDFSQEISIPDANTNITRSTPLNYANMHHAGFSTYYNFNKWSRWNSFTGFNVSYQLMDSKIDFVRSVRGWNSYFYSNNDFTLNKSKTLFASVNYGLQLPGRYQIFQISTMHILDISVQALFFKKKLSLGLTWQDVLNGQRPVISYYSNGIKTTIQGYEDSRSLRVSVSYKFGNDNLKSKERSFGNEEEQNRTN
ncbi:outer membrane beta-barrel family protein [Fluviicola sp.]|uniref:TonB-dependent receptor domain-containing protein n=1 Tax=Fluviicola sp. TaxID=1917219 RepID=UPI002637DB99|nr:outer membrane beta-barrel family protein [Fluviicola sp.]